MMKRRLFLFFVLITQITNLNAQTTPFDKPKRGFVSLEPAPNWSNAQ
jgi:hypothetical protein